MNSFSGICLTFSSLTVSMTGPDLAARYPGVGWAVRVSEGEGGEGFRSKTCVCVCVCVCVSEKGGCEAVCVDEAVSVDSGCVCMCVCVSQAHTSVELHPRHWGHGTDRIDNFRFLELYVQGLGEQTTLKTSKLMRAVLNAGKNKPG